MKINTVALPKIMKLEQSFIDAYQTKSPNWGFGGLGYIIYLRTYARKKADGTLEKWFETVRRFTEGNFDIEWQHLRQLGKDTTENFKNLYAEMERFYHLAFNLVILPPGRGIWMSGTDYAKRNGDAENNCWNVVMKPQAFKKGEKTRPSFPLVFGMSQLMKGGGVGFNVQRKNVNQMPRVQNAVELTVHVRNTHPDLQELLPLGVVPYIEGNGCPVDAEMISDDREGWEESLGIVVDAHFDGNKKVNLDISGIRERGQDIKGFGGVASGPAPLVELLLRVNDIIDKKAGGFLTPTEWADCGQSVGKCVVAGNVRRSAIIIIGDNDDQEFVESKNYSLPQNQVASQWRWASNNSVDVGPNTPKSTFRTMSKAIYYNGEPGYTNLELSRNTGRLIDGWQEGIDAEVEGFNPCGEIPLPNGSPCNLFEMNLPAIHEWIKSGKARQFLDAFGLQDRPADYLLELALTLGTHYAYRVTFRNYDWDVTKDIVTRHRRLGIGLTGVADYVLLAHGRKAILGFEEDGITPIFNPNVTKALDEMYEIVKKANKEQAKHMEANESIKVTTIKPSGTISILMGVSPGLHQHWSEYMIRRVRMSADSPLVPALLECGYYVEPAIQGQDENGNNVYDYKTVVAEFPIKATTAGHEDFQSAGDVPLKEQAALQELLAHHWADNAVSATLSFRKGATPEEDEKVIEEITEILYRAKDHIKSTSLLPYSTDTFPQMPYEQIDKATYEKKVAKIKGKVWEVLTGDIMEMDEVEDASDCIGGSCPVK